MTVSYTYRTCRFDSAANACSDNESMRLYRKLSILSDSATHSNARECTFRMRLCAKLLRRIVGLMFVRCVVAYVLAHSALDLHKMDLLRALVAGRLCEPLIVDGRCAQQLVGHPFEREILVNDLT